MCRIKRLKCPQCELNNASPAHPHVYMPCTDLTDWLSLKTPEPGMPLLCRMIAPDMRGHKVKASCYSHRSDIVLDPKDDLFSTAMIVCNSTPTHLPLQLSGWDEQHHAHLPPLSVHWHEIYVPSAFIAEIRAGKQDLPCNWIEQDESACRECPTITAYQPQVSTDNTQQAPAQPRRSYIRRNVAPSRESSAMSRSHSGQSIQIPGTQSLGSMPVPTPGSGGSAMPPQQYATPRRAIKAPAEAIPPSDEVSREQGTESLTDNRRQQLLSVALEPARTYPASEETWREFTNMNFDSNAVSDEVEARQRAGRAGRASTGSGSAPPGSPEIARRNVASTNTRLNATSGDIDYLMDPSPRRAIGLGEDVVPNVEEYALKEDDGTVTNNKTSTRKKHQAEDEPTADMSSPAKKASKRRRL